MNVFMVPYRLFYRAELQRGLVVQSGFKPLTKAL